MGDLPRWEKSRSPIKLDGAFERFGSVERNEATIALAQCLDCRVQESRCHTPPLPFWAHRHTPEVTVVPVRRESDGPHNLVATPCHKDRHLSQSNLQRR